MFLRLKLTFALVTALVLGACAAPDRVSVGARAGTLGFGAESAVRVNNRVVLRGVATGAEMTMTETLDGVDYDGALSLGGTGLQADISPFRSGFYVSVGAFHNRNAVDLDAAIAPTESVTLGDTTYTGAQVGALAATADFNSVAGYVGTGWSGSVLRSRLVAFVEAGAYLQGSPAVTYTATGALASDPTFIADLEAEAASVEDDLSIAGTYPVATVGLRLRF